MRYEYECWEHGRREVSKPMTLSGRDEFCPDCLHRAERNHAALPPPMRRIYGEGVLVQNHSLSDEAGSLRSWGEHERMVKVSKAEWFKNARRERLEREVDK